ncbi:hypothetical protein CWI75_10715 [Kineobactrum sediminis]|uniref:Uncharacterized protein n=1 Tax=Kineobactrum sediminis TaxID=1905677 RepID=A0A2N5Y1G8_9GAMM|nr:hypothetical protein CWI75_10715 [Kineobactrum sediminis]
MRDLRRFEKQIQRLQAEVGPKDVPISFNQLSETDAKAVRILARVSRDLHGHPAILRPSFRGDEAAMNAISRKAVALAVKYQALPFSEKPGIDEEFHCYLLEHHAQHVDHEAYARNRGQ